MTSPVTPHVTDDDAAARPARAAASPSLELKEGLIMTRLTTNHPYGTPCWADLGIPDLRRAMDFYTALFGWEIQEGPAETGRYSTCLVDGSPVAAISPSHEEDQASFWWTVYFATDDADASAKRVTEAGGTIVMPVMDVMGQGRMVLADDPSGARFGLWQGQAHTGAQIIAERDAMCWTELSTPDSADARRFYQTVLERPVEDLGVPNFDYATVKADEESVAGIWGVPGEAPRWTIYFGVDDADAAVARTTAAGGSLLQEPKDSPYGRFAIIADPAGAVLTVVEVLES
jgi:predicted enzyme related to lactoylglutathione lyase